MKFVDGGDLSFEELERIMFLGGGLSKKRRKKMMLTHRKLSPSRSISEKVTAPAEIEFMDNTSMKLQYAVMCKKVPMEANELELFKFFTFNGGKMRDVAILYSGDRPTGTAFVEFLEYNSLRQALSKSNPEIFGKSIILRAAQDVLDEHQRTHGNTKDAADACVNRRLRITNLLAVINESDMLGIFKPFGNIEAIDMHRKDGRKVCEIIFSKEADARDAIHSMQGFELAGQALKLQLGDDTFPCVPPPPPGAPGVIGAFSQQRTQAVYMPETANSNMCVDPRLEAEPDTDFGATRRTECSAAQARIDLMRKLATRDVKKGRITNPHSRTIRLKNMFDPSGVDLKEDPNFVVEIQDDILEECKKFGGAARVDVDSNTGLVHLLFKDFLGRQKAENVLGNRWFGGRRIECEVVDDISW